MDAATLEATAPSDVKAKARAKKSRQGSAQADVTKPPESERAIDAYRRERSEQTAMTQMNVRIPRSLKQQGDEALSAMGVSPSQVVRRVYELAVQYEREPRKFIDLFSLEPPGQRAAFMQRVRAFKEGPLIIGRAREELGLPGEPSPEMRRILNLSWKDMREELDDLEARDDEASELTGRRNDLHG